MKQGLLFSIIIHSVLLLLITLTEPNDVNKENGNLDGKAQGRAGGGSGQETNIEIIPSVKTGDKGLPCKEFYGGVGITVSFRFLPDQTMEQIAYEIVEGYPAALSGMKLNDVILNGEVLRGNIGEEITVYIKRNDIPMTLVMTRGKICTEKTQ